MCVTGPDSRRVAAALDACPPVVVDELFLGETARHADVVLAVVSWLEKDGTFVNFDRRFQRVRAAVRPPGEEPDADRPLLPATGRRWAHYGSGSMTRYGVNILLDTHGRLGLHPRTPRGTACGTALPSSSAVGTDRRG
ncbi:molybdopterin-dependent oxidoreductase [Streptomyces diastatochromogenes]|nr:molybdopterin-dependent oxidoreductase [Streptomyces diastatochromogenes]